jgi:hypothetical protein
VKRSLLGAVVLAAALASPVSAAPRPTPSCYITDGILYAVNLPIDEPLAFTNTLYPSGVGWRTQDGTATFPVSVSPVYIWQRGGGKSLLKAGPQLNDYHVIAVCE